MSEWISAKYRLPAADKGRPRTSAKLVYCPTIECTFTATYNVELKCWEHFQSGDEFVYAVSDWMELPPPPL